MEPDQRIILHEIIMDINNSVYSDKIYLYFLFIISYKSPASETKPYLYNNSI